MRSDTSLAKANLFLYDYKNKWVRKIKKVDLNRAKRHANFFRFIDDLKVINDGGEIELTYKKICPLELEPKK